MTLDNLVWSKLIESGPFNGCWEVLDKETGDVYYMKVIEKDSQDFDFNTFSAEVTLYLDHKHNYLPKLIQFREDDEFYYIVFEKPPTYSIYDHIRNNGPMTENESKNFLNSLLEIITLLNTEPMFLTWGPSYETIFVNESGNVTKLYPYVQNSCMMKFSDFAYAQTSPPEYFTSNPNILTTVQLTTKSTSSISAASLQSWFIGIILYFISFNKFPFDGLNVDDIRKSVLTEHPTYPDRASKEIKDLISKLLMKNSIFRPRIDAILDSSFMLSDALSTKSMTRAHSQSSGFALRLTNPIFSIKKVKMTSSTSRTPIISRINISSKRRFSSRQVIDISHF
ncbi:hypothetical protein TRFO_36587 [Tritrichomonas foetus]|uniref:Protein kinase domain-containing protein n=1 Tax=Tritrichomonas foetus TaxID=1144522 RepID=A0A1J4JEY5_9EUKA|nr:hypothetical protein TRFO_36587 [Tritrichomonas foetus]|eukprot:OHS97233.1 hypothetical protein TRFO_36587 [Tritrichomonas foetus]